MYNYNLLLLLSYTNDGIIPRNARGWGVSDPALRSVTGGWAGVGISVT